VTGHQCDLPQANHCWAESPPPVHAFLLGAFASLIRRDPSASAASGQHSVPEREAPLGLAPVTRPEIRA
jgi:hypothetical protein